MAYDLIRNGIVLFGGTKDGHLYNDTWEYKENTLTRQLPTGDIPDARYSQTMAYDACWQVTVLLEKLKA